MKFQSAFDSLTPLLISDVIVSPATKVVVVLSNSSISFGVMSLPTVQRKPEHWETHSELSTRSNGRPPKLRSGQRTTKPIINH